MDNLQNALNKVKGKAKALKFHLEHAPNQGERSVVVKQMEICKTAAYPDFVFVVFQNMIYRKDSLADSSYSVFSFDINGNYVEEVKLADLPSNFINDRETVTLI